MCDCSKEWARELWSKCTRLPFLTKLLTNLMERFPKCDVVEVFSIIDPAGLLRENEVARNTWMYYWTTTQRMGGQWEFTRKAAPKTTVNSFHFQRNMQYWKNVYNSLQEVAEKVRSNTSTREVFPKSWYMHWFYQYHCERGFSVMKQNLAIEWTQQH